MSCGMEPLEPQTVYDLARARVPAFCKRHYSVIGTLRLHRSALGWDLIRAPINVVLAVLQLVLRLFGSILAVIGARRFGRWLSTRSVMLPTDLGRRVEYLVRREIFADDTSTEPPLLSDYAGTRTAVADMTTSLGALSTGAIAFKTVTPGVVSLAPFVALNFAQAAAIAAFPLGGAMGSAWYYMFPTQAPLWMMVGFGIGLAMAAAVLTTFAGVVADPIQNLLGLHQRRLIRLINRIEAQQSGPAKGFGTGEHLLARLGDLTDLVLGFVRHFRP